MFDRTRFRIWQKYGDTFPVPKAKENDSILPQSIELRRVIYSVTSHVPPQRWSPHLKDGGCDSVLRGQDYRTFHLGGDRRVCSTVNDWKRKPERKPAGGTAPMSHGIAWDWTRSSAVESQGLTAWAMTRLNIGMSFPIHCRQLAFNARLLPK